MIQTIFEKYIQSITTKFSYPETSEMGYRTDFEMLLREIFESVNVTRFDHDAKTSNGNKPDFVVRKHGVPILYIETKNIGESLDKIEKSEQMSRYYGYTNLILTDYIEFRFYRNGVRYEEPIKIANYHLKSRIIEPASENYEYAAKTILDFTHSYKEPIKSGKHLAKIMGGKAQRIRDNLRHFFLQESKNDTDVVRLYKTIKKLLVHDLTHDSFADMYAQTLVYGLFVARYYDKSSGTFSRQEARELIPNSNKLLRHFFDHIVGADFDTRLKFIVDELCAVFSHADIQELMKEYFKQDDLWGKSQEGPDPVIHFYEDFLEEYDADLRKKMGAYYTPLPVVRFITQSVDYLLKKEFGLSAGLADTSKTAEGVHKVQILDPAVGTGTFISAVIRIIYESLLKNGQKGRWPAYVHNDLLPRLHGFELMMAPYTIAHLKLGIAFRQTGFWDFHRRLGIYLTNSLEEGIIQQDLLAFGLAESIAEESQEASKIKNDTPIMIVIGNPPYSGVSSNETEYANGLVERYKVEAGGKQKLQERKHWLNDDYVKFIALAEKMCEKTGNGIVSMITNNGYLDNPTFRGMRWHLAKTFDKIYLLDLHGNAKKKEITPDGGKDENIFDIMQGVGILLAVKTGKKKLGELAEVYHADLYGTRKHKFNELAKSPQWQQLTLDSKMVYFVPKDTKGDSEYEKGIKVNELFSQNITGIITMGDSFIIDVDKNVIAERLQKLAQGEYNENTLNTKFSLGKNYAKFVLGNHKKLQFDETKLVKLNYRPFDVRWTYFDNKVVWRWRENVMKHFIPSNIGIALTRNLEQKRDWADIIVIDSMITHHSLSIKEVNYLIPLYLYNDEGIRIANFNPELLKVFTKNIGTDYEPEDILDYIYAVLYSLKYREKYIEFLKIDFPRVPTPKNPEIFKKLVKLGQQLRELHLLESPKINEFIITYPESGSNIVEKLMYKNGNVFINETQYFGNVPEIAWNFYIGGYQPAQKWLKDRKGRVLTNEDLEHYQKIIVALTETNKCMIEIDQIITI